MTYKEEMEKINNEIKELEKIGKTPSKVLYIKQIELLEKAHKEFIEKAVQHGYDLQANLDILETEIKQFSAMKQIARKAGFPTEKYDKYIKESRIRVYGKEATEMVFGDK